MKRPYEKELYELRKWIDVTNAQLSMQYIHAPQEIQRVYQWITVITRGIQEIILFMLRRYPILQLSFFRETKWEQVF